MITMSLQCTTSLTSVVLVLVLVLLYVRVPFMHSTGSTYRFGEFQYRIGCNVAVPVVLDLDLVLAVVLSMVLS